MSISKQFVTLKPASSDHHPVSGNVTGLDLSRIRLDGDTQSRADIIDSVVDEYAEAITEGATFPPVVVFKDGNRYWLADGFHRYHAHQRAKKATIAAVVRVGNKRDAVLYSVGANATHGLPRSNDDKRRAVLTVLNDSEWAKKAEKWIAETCSVSRTLVRAVIADHPHLVQKQDRPATREVERGGVTYSMDTAAIGKKAVGSDANALPPEKLPGADNATDAPEDASDIVPSIHEETRQSLPPAIKDREQANAEWRAKAQAAKPALYDGLPADQRIAELEEAGRVFEAENATLATIVAEFGDMRVQFERGGFEKVIADKDEQIRVLNTRIVGESADKASWMKSAKYWQAEAKRLGWSDTVEINIQTAEVTGG